MRDWFNKLEVRVKRLVGIIAIISLVGTSTLTKVLTSSNAKIKRQNTNGQVLSAQLQSLHPVLYTGEVEIFRKKFFGLWYKPEGKYPVQIRYSDYYIEDRDEYITILWVYVRVSGEMEIYHAIPYNEGFYFYDWNMDKQWIYNIVKE